MSELPVDSSVSVRYLEVDCKSLGGNLKIFQISTRKILQAMITVLEFFVEKIKRPHRDES